VIQQSPSDDGDCRYPAQSCLPASPRNGKDRWWFCRPSIRMFNLLLSDCGCPRVLSFLPDRVTGLLKIRISEHPDSYCDQLGALLGFPENRSPTFWTEVECHSSTAICSTRISLGDALSEPDLLSRIECLNTESASRTALAFEAVAHGDADGVASNCYLELSATACGFAIRHVDCLSTETRNRTVREHSSLYLETPVVQYGIESRPSWFQRLNELPGDQPTKSAADDGDLKVESSRIVRKGQSPRGPSYTARSRQLNRSFQRGHSVIHAAKHSTRLETRPLGQAMGSLSG
jgi:hypothetical protein